MVDVDFVARLERFVSLETLKATPGLEEMMVTKPTRFSVQPVAESEFRIVAKLGGVGPEVG